MPKIHLSIVILMLSHTLFSQYDHYKSLNYHPPVDIPILLAGNFAELRSNHFHGGLDIKTQSEEGHKILSIEDGYVYRIKVSEYGYGKCLYVEHPKTGHRSVYAHLQKFSPQIEAYVKKMQYKKESYTIELFPQKGELPVSRGELVAISGNTGSSSGPHLHFEIRDLNDVTLNPLLFGFNIRDEIPPNINILAIYPAKNQKVNQKNKALFISPLKRTSGEYYIQKKIEVSGDFYVGVSTIDYLNNSRNRCGIFSIRLNVEGETVFEHRLEQVSFSETRYINALVDYSTWKRTGSKIQKCYVDPGNKLNTYSKVQNSGLIRFEKEGTYNLELIVKDAYHNTSVLPFQIINIPKTDHGSETQPKETFVKTFSYDKHNSFQSEHCMVTVPKGALYKDLSFSFHIDSTDNPSHYLSPIYKIHDRYTPLHKRMTLSIKSPLNIEHIEKTYIAEVDRGTHYNRTSFSNNFFTTTTKYLGHYTLMEDIKAPVITNKSFTSGQKITGTKKIRFKISDNRSGIKSYKAYIDGQWVLFEYEYKKRQLTYIVDDYFPKTSGKHQIELFVTDKVGNVATYAADFYL